MSKSISSEAITDRQTGHKNCGTDAYLFSGIFTINFRYLSWRGAENTKF